MPTNVSKQVISWLERDQFKDMSNDFALELGTYIIETLASSRNVLTFEEEDAGLKKQVAEIYAAKKDFERAAKILDKINLESAQR